MSTRILKNCAAIVGNDIARKGERRKMSATPYISAILGAWSGEMGVGDL